MGAHRGMSLSALPSPTFIPQTQRDHDHPKLQLPSLEAIRAPLSVDGSSGVHWTAAALCA